MKIKVFEYKSCSTCQKANKFLESKKIDFERVPIVEQPPTLKELEQMLEYLKAAGLTFKNLFNTSGVQYRELKIADQMKAGMSESQALQLLSKNGKLIKRPFLLTPQAGTVGFKEEVWRQILGH